MTFDIDCARSVLLAVEDLEYNQYLNIPALHERLPKFEADQLEYTCLILADGGYLNVTSFPVSGSIMPRIKSINNMTHKGHEFLENIRDNKIWSGIKSIAEKLARNPWTLLSKLHPTSLPN